MEWLLREVFAAEERHRRLVNGIDAQRVGVFLCLLGDFEQRPEILFRRGQRGHFCHRTAVSQVLENALGMSTFFAGLLVIQAQ